MAKIKKREWTNAKGEIKFAWKVDYRDNAGKRRAKQFARKKDAEAWLTNAAWEVSKGIHTADSQSITIKDAASYWLDAARANNREPTTIAAYEQHVRLHIVPLCGAWKLSQITAPMVKKLLSTWLETRSRPMVKRVFQSLKGIIAEAQGRGLVAQNVATSVKMKNAPREKSKITIPTAHELLAILTAAEKQGVREYAFVCLMVFTGMRASELRGVCWASIDLRLREVGVFQRADAFGDIGDPKSRSGNRTIPLSDRAVAALTAWKLACPPNALGLVFPSVGGRVMAHGVVVKTILGPVQAAAGTTDRSKMKYTLHDFRHAAASMWIAENFNPKRVQVLMGHSSIQMTFDTYGHLFERAGRDAGDANAIARALQRDAT